jgi:hypothetical protein
MAVSPAPGSIEFAIGGENDSSSSPRMQDEVARIQIDGVSDSLG